MANTRAYIQSLQNKEGVDVYPVTVGDAVYIQTSDGSTVTQKKLTAALSEIDTKMSEMETNFTDGCNTIVSALKELGVTPSATTPEGIVTAIKEMYANRYSLGFSNGAADVVADPAKYGLITEDEYEAYGTEQYNKGVSDGTTEGIKNLSVSSVTTSCSGSCDADSGSRLEMSSNASATAYIRSGRLYVSVNMSASGTASHWDSGSWTQKVSDGYSKSNSTSTAFA